MTLRTRLILVFTFLVGLLMATAVVSAIGLKNLLDVATETHAAMDRTFEICGKGCPETGPTARELMRLRQEITAKEQEFRDTMNAAGIQLGLLVLISLVSLTILTPSLQRSFLTRLLALRQLAEEVRHVGGRRRIHFPGGDELSAVAETINRLLEQLEDSQSRSLGRIGQQRSLVLTLLSQIPGAIGIIDEQGRLRASTLDAESEKIWYGHEPLLKSAIDAGQSQLSLPNDKVSLTPLERACGAPIAWLVRRL